MITKSVCDFVEKVRGMKVAVVGETITDEFVYVSYEGQSMKSICPVFKLEDKTERHQGGAAAIANHLRGFVEIVDLVSNDPDDIIKTRYLDVSDQKKHVEINKFRIDKSKYYNIKCADYDAVIVADFGHGFCDLLQIDNGFHLMCQTNSNNFGFNRISKWRSYRKKSVCIDLREASLQMNKKVDFSQQNDVNELYNYELQSENLIITLGTKGSIFYNGEKLVRKGVFKSDIVDTIGAGDTFFAFVSLTTQLGMDDKLTIPSLAASLSTTWLCNQKSVTPSTLLEHATKFL